MKLKGVQNYSKKEISFNGYKIEAIDAPSFLDQYEAIFYNECYRFNTASNSPVIFDCGANIGMASLYLKKLFPSAKIKAFEADPLIANSLKRNLERNNLEDVEVIEKAVWVEDATVGFHSEGGQGGALDNSSNSSIQSIRLRSVLEKETRIDFLKLDIEGAELEVLKDCKDQLHKVTILFVEYHQIVDKKEQLGELLTLLEQSGFTYFIQNNSIQHPFLFESNKKVQQTVEVFAKRST